MYNGSSTKGVPLHDSTAGTTNRIRFVQLPKENVPETSKCGKNWTLWTLRETVLADMFWANSKLRKQGDLGQPPRIWTARKEMVQELVNKSLGSTNNFRELKADFIAVQSRPMNFGSVHASKNENIWRGQTFSYNHIEGKLEMDVQELVFQGRKVQQKTDPGLIRLKAYMGLAQILASIIKTNDVLLISGMTAVLRNPRDERRELELNGRKFAIENLSSGNHVEIIRLCFDVPLSNEMRFIERIRPWKDQFEFLYAGTSSDNKRKSEIIRYRGFNLEMEPHRLSGWDLFPMPITRDCNAMDAYHMLMDVNTQTKRKSTVPDRPKLSAKSRYSNLRTSDVDNSDVGDESFFSTADTSFEVRSTRYSFTERYWSEGCRSSGVHCVLELLGMLFVTLFFIGIIYYALNFTNFHAYTRAIDECQREEKEFLDSVESGTTAAPGVDLPPVVENYWN